MTGNTTYTVTVTNSNGCVSVAKNGTVTVNALPVVSTVSSSTPCAGGTSALTATLSSGTTTSMTYSWNIGGTTSTTTVNTKTSQALTGNTTYTVTVTNSNGCVSVAKAGTVTVNALPAAPTGASSNTRCGSGNVTFSATTATGCTIDWYNASTNGSIVSDGTGTATFSPSLSATTTYYAQSRNTATGCVSASRLAVTGTIHTAVGGASISGDESNTCPTTTVSLSATASSATTFTWYKDGVQQTGTGSTYTVTASGSYTVQGKNANCTGTTSASKVVNIIDCRDVPGCAPLKLYQFTSSYDGDEDGTWAVGVDLCKSLGARLPTTDELLCMCKNKDKLNGGYVNGKYVPYDSDKVGDHNSVNFSDCSNNLPVIVNFPYYYRCVL